jgi:EAL domain-containing protein (putative c-di-GMP-specific phosphodiesterase class I)
MDGIVLAEKQLEKDLKIALTNNELVQYIQPQYSLSENRIVGFESLLRWNNPNYIDKPIQQVVELAEQKGYMLDMAKIIIDNTFELAKKLEKYNVSISLNLSPIQIIQAGFVSELVSKFEEYNLKEGSIALEITETFLMRNFMLVNEKLKILKRAGFKIHLDDFCTGYSSMKYLKDLPVDSIKIDQEFIKHVNTNKVNKSIVSCITDLAKELNLEVIAEGVENSSQRDTIKKIGCKIIQGYLIGKAMPYEQAVALLEKKK